MVFVTEIRYNSIFRRLPGKELLGHAISHLKVKSDVECMLRCQRHPGCKSINYVRSNSESDEQRTCELNEQVNGALSEILQGKEESCHFVVV